MMRLRGLLAASLISMLAACASLPPPVVDTVALTVDQTRMDPDGRIEPGLLREALASYARHFGTVERDTKIFDLPGKRIESEVSPIGRDRIGVVDFRLPASSPRFFVVDLKTGRVAAFRVAHGRNSDPDGGPMAEPGLLMTRKGAVRASNRLDSNESAVGAFVAANIYNDGRWPGSVRLHGLDATNSCTYYRAIVLHQVQYMTPMPTTGEVGTSDGCFAVEASERATIAGLIADGGFVYAGPRSLHIRSNADGLTTQQACEAVRLKPELGPQLIPPGS